MKTKQINKMSFIVVALVTIFLSTEVGLALPKSSPDVLIREAEVFIREMDYTKALGVVKKLQTDYSDHPDIVEVISDLANRYRTQKNDRAIELYEYILSKHPSHDLAMRAQFGLAKWYIQKREYSKAQAAFEKLLANYSDHPEIVEVIGNLVKCYMWEKEYSKAQAAFEKLLANYSDHPEIVEVIWDLAEGSIIESYQHIVSNNPSHDLAVWAQHGIAQCYIRRKEYIKAQAAIEKLLTDCSDHPDIGKKVISNIAYVYRTQKEYDRLIALYQYILSKYPSHNLAVQAQAGLARCYVEKKDDSKAEAAVEKLLSNYSDHPDIVRWIGRLADSYYKKKTDKAIELYQHILSKYPLHNWAVRAQSGLAICYIRKNEDVKAVAAIKKLLANYSDHPDIAECIGAVAGSYRSKKYDRAVELYQYILSKYPSHDWVKQARSDNDIIEVFAVLADSYRKKKSDKAIELYQYILSDHFSDKTKMRKYKMHAQYRLARIYVDRYDDPKADAAVEKLLANYSDQPKVVEYICRIAESYPKQKADKAVELYRHVLIKYPSHEWVKRTKTEKDIVKVFLILAKSYREGNEDKRIELCQFILSRYPSHDRAIWAQARIVGCYIRQKKDLKGQDAFEKLLANYSSHPDLLAQINALLKFFDDEDQAKKYIFDKLIDGEKSVQIQKTGVLYCIKYFYRETVLDAFNRIVPKLAKDPDSLIILSEIADSCHELQKDEIAINIYQIYLRDYAIEADKEKVKLKLFESMYAAGAGPEKILIALEEYAGRHKATDVNLAASAIVLRGRIFANLGEIDKAISEFLLIINKYPKAKESPEAGYFVGYCYMLQGKFDQAKEVLNLVVKDYPQSSYASKAKLYLTRIESMTE